MRRISLCACAIVAVALTGCPEKKTEKPVKDPAGKGEAKIPDESAEEKPNGQEEPASEAKPLTEKEAVAMVLAMAPGAPHGPEGPAGRIDPAFVNAVHRVDGLRGRIDFDAQGKIMGVDLTTNRGECTDADLAPLLVFKGIRKMKIGGGKLTDMGMETVAAMPGVVDIFIQYAAITDSGIDALKPLKLRALGIRDTLDIGDGAVKKIVANFPELQTLRLIEQSGVTAESISEIRNLEKLRSLDLRGCEISAGNLAELAKLENLKALKVGAESAYLDDTALEEIAGMKNLTALAVEKSAVSDDGLKLLVELALADLSLAHCSSIMDDGMTSIAKISSLKKLNLVETGITDEGVAALAELPLVQLSLGKTFLGDGALDHIVKIKTLTRLDMDETQVSNDGLEKFQQLPALTSLNLTYCGQVNDDGIESLARMKNLKSLNIAKTGITIDGAKKLEKALPGCTIVSKEGG